VMPVFARDTLIVGSQKAHVLVFDAAEVNEVAGPAKGVTAIKLDEDDKVVGFALARQRGDGLTLTTDAGREVTVTRENQSAAARGGKGIQVVKRSEVKWVPPPIELIDLPQGSA
jgi:DNA gyrase subunit A